MFNKALNNRSLVNVSKYLNINDFSVLFYLSITLLLTFFKWNEVVHPEKVVIFRILVLLFLVSVVYLEQKANSPILRFIHIFYPLALLAYLYPETADLNRVFFKPFDSILLQFEKHFLDTDFSLVFSQIIPYKWFNEWLSMGYFSFYFLIFGTALWFYWYKKEDTLKTIFIIISSFNVFYVIFIVFPVVGPQFFYSGKAAEIDSAYLFSFLVKLTQELGERPTGAFPSSHTGITIILLLISFKSSKRLFKIILFFAVPLVMATVYIKAHYVSDVIAGALVAPIFFIIFNKLYNKLSTRITALKPIS